MPLMLDSLYTTCVSTKKNYRAIAELSGDNVLRIDLEGTPSHLWVTLNVIHFTLAL